MERLEHPVFPVLSVTKITQAGARNVSVLGILMVYFGAQFTSQTLASVDPRAVQIYDNFILPFNFERGFWHVCFIVISLGSPISGLV